MSVVAWDGKVIAADKQATNIGLRSLTTKIRKLTNGDIIAWTGDQDSALAMASWYENGALQGAWPESQKDKEGWARLIVLSDGKVIVYERQPFPIVVEEPFMAWGSGRDYAIGALAQGANAVQAVTVASRYDSSCGLGIDFYECDAAKQEEPK